MGSLQKRIRRKNRSEKMRFSMTIDLNSHQIGAIIHFSMKEDYAAGNHKGERRGFPCAVCESSPTVQAIKHNPTLMPDPNHVDPHSLIFLNAVGSLMHSFSAAFTFFSPISEPVLNCYQLVLEPRHYPSSTPKSASKIGQGSSSV